jgi:acetyl-CoA carboxylase biotin carboxyl carrier protein
MAMDFKQIQELIRLVNKSNIGELIVEEKGFSITIKQKQEPAQHIIAAPSAPSPVMMPAAHAVAPVLQPAPAGQPAQEKSRPQEPAPAANTITIKSPMIGTFYRSPSPGKPPFVEVGSEIEPGKPVCIIEAMKLFNEIESEVKGRIVKIMVDDASPVEYDQPLFMVEPS